MDHSHKHEDPTLGRGKWVLIGFLIIAGFFLFTEHRAHLLGILPYMLILACPLMHLFHHGHGHKHQGGNSSHPTNKRPGQEQVEERP
jgi:hypothetical protein